MTPVEFDISVPTSSMLPMWPGSPGFKISRHLEIAAGDDANASQIQMDVHVGTHVDAPLHFIPGGADLQSTGLEPFVGAAYVTELVGPRQITADILEQASIPSEVTRLLLKTQRDGDWFRRPFDEDFAALTVDGAEWAVERNLALIGIDYVSIQRFHDGPATHQVLLGNDVCILEGLDLSAVTPGHYDLFCLPIRLAAAEAAPARAILRSID
jgi:arylformamidase